MPKLKLKLAEKEIKMEMATEMEALVVAVGWFLAPSVMAQN